MEQSERIQVLEANLGRIISWIQAADGKVNLIFSVNTAMLGVIAAVGLAMGLANNGGQAPRTKPLCANLKRPGAGCFVFAVPRENETVAADPAARRPDELRRDAESRTADWVSGPAARSDVGAVAMDR